MAAVRAGDFDRTQAVELHRTHALGGISQDGDMLVAGNTARPVIMPACNAYGRARGYPLEFARCCTHGCNASARRLSSLFCMEIPFQQKRILGWYFIGCCSIEDSCAGRGKLTSKKNCGRADRLHAFRKAIVCQTLTTKAWALVSAVLIRLLVHPAPKRAKRAAPYLL